MPVLPALLDALRSGAVEVVDLTAPLTESTPVLELPAPFVNTSRFRLEELSRYDDRGPAWYWNDIHTGEHTGTHLDAPNHWVTGRDGLDVSSAPTSTLVAPAVVIDKSAEVGDDPDFLLEVAHIEAWVDEHGPLPDGGWLLYRTGWDARSHDQEAFANADADGPHTPGVSAECAQWIAQESPVSGFGTETVGTDAGAAGGFDPPFSCHHFLMGAGKWGLTSLQNVATLPPTGAVVVVSPLPIVGGSGSPARVFALVEAVTTVAEAVGRTLAVLGVAHAYGVVGSGNFAVTNALRNAGVPFTAARHEGSAATMADAHARTSGDVTVLTLHQGCGLTNAMTGIGEAAKSRTQLIVLAADVAGSAVRSNFRVDQDALARAVGAVPERVHSADSAVADVVRAFRVARQQRRTVVLSMPLDVQAAECLTPIPATAIEPWGPTRPDTASVASLAALLDGAERPVFIAGRGARDAGPELEALAAQCGALLTTSAVAHGLFAGADWSLGICGGFATELAATLVVDADLVVAFGASLTMWTTRHGALIGEGATVVQVDDDPAALGANCPIDLGVLGDVGEVARDLATAVSGSPGYRTAEVANRLEAEGRWSLVPIDDTSTGDRIDPRVLSSALDELLPMERTVAIDSGNFMGYPAAYLSIPDVAGFCFTQAFQSVGLGLSTAIGAAIARPDRLTVAALGDGGFLMGVSELETAARLGLGLLVVVYDDAAYGAEVHHFVDADHSTVTFPDRDLAEVGRGFGCDGLVVRSVDDLAGVSAWLDGPRARPLVVDAKVVADAPSWWLAEAFRGH